MSIIMFLKKLRHDYFLRKKEYYYELYKKELKKEETFSRTTYNIDGKEVTITNYTEHVPFFIRRDNTTLSSKSIYYNRYLYYSNKLLKHQI